MSSELTKVISRNLSRTRDLDDIRKRNSTRLQETRKSQRTAALNQLRQVAEIPKVEKKKTAAEQKLELLKAYQVEKRKRMEDQKKKQRPPFNNFVKSRHTGGTPFRETKPEPKSRLLKTVLCLPANTRAHAQATKHFEFKATVESNTQSKERSAPTRVLGTNEKKKPFPSQPSTSGIPTKITKKPVSAPKKPVVENKKPLKEADKPKPIKPITRQQRVVPQKSVPTNVKPPTTRAKPKPDTNITERRVLRNRENLSNKIPAPVPQKNAQKTTQKARDITVTDKGKRTNKNSANKENLPNTGNNLLSVETKRRPGSSGSNKSTEGSGQKVATRASSRQRKTRTQPNSPVASPPVTQEEVAPESNSNEITEVAAEQPVEETRGTDFQRLRLQNETDRLNNEADNWAKQLDNNIPEHIRDEILSVVGQTKLLLSEKFQTFKFLIGRCESEDEAGPKTTLDDLEGYWDVMYQQVIQLDKKFRNLCDLESNNWEEKTSSRPKKTVKKTTAKQPAKPKAATSKFREFLKSRKNGTEGTEEAPVELPQTPKKSIKRPETPESMLYMSVCTDFDCNDFEKLCSPSRITPAVRKVLETSRRRSSLAVLTLRNAQLMKIAASPVK